MMPNGMALSQSFLLSWGTMKDSGTHSKGAYWGLRRFWEAYLQTPDTLKKKKEFAGKSQSRPSHELAAAQGRGGVRGPFHQA